MVAVRNGSDLKPGPAVITIAGVSMTASRAGRWEAPDAKWGNKANRAGGMEDGARVACLAKSGEQSQFRSRSRSASGSAKTAAER